MPTVYGVNASPFVRKVRVVLTEKGIPYELEPVVPVNVSPEFRRMSPLGKIPAFRDGAVVQLDGRDTIVGSRFSIGDIGIATQFVNLRHAGFGVDQRRWPKLARYVDTLLARASFKALIDEEAASFGAAA